MFFVAKKRKRDYMSKKKNKDKTEEAPATRRFIEETFPVKEVSKESARGKNIRHGHISTLHIWWARKPLASSRATNFASLIPTPKNEKERKEISDFIVELSKWENTNDQQLLNRARKMILDANDGKPPKVLDPFGGGGAIPLEALRLGCETYSNDYNPVAVLIQKCTLEYPQKYGKPVEVEREADEFGKKVKKKFKVDNVLLEDVKHWGNWVLEEAKKEIGKFYPEDPDGSIPVGYIWARTIPCQNPTCINRDGKPTEIPLMHQFWLAKKSNKKISLYPFIEKVGQASRLSFKIVSDLNKETNKKFGYEEFPDDFDPSEGTVSRAIVTCPVCGSVIEAKTTRKLFQDGKAPQRMVAVVLHHPKKQGKTYRLATKKDLEVFRESEKYLEEKRAKLMEEYGIDPVPDEPTPEGKGRGAERAFSVRNYGLNAWGDLFNSRQKLALITFVEKVRQAHEKMLTEGVEEEYAKAVVSYLAIVISRMSDFETVLCRWYPQWEFIPNTFARQVLPMSWGYAELNLFSPVLTGTFESMLRQIIRVIEDVSKMNSTPAFVTQASATSLPYPDNYFDAVFTDPPYYDNVPYSYLSDFFYVWLKRTIGDLYPDLFSTPLTPKSKEIVAYTNERSWDEAKEFFEENLKKSFQEIYRVLKPDGIATIVYAHKSTSGWETLINSLLDSGLVVKASWSIDTEMKTRLRAKESAALASSIYFVVRKMKREETGWLNEVKEELRRYLDKKLDKLWEEGIGGADFFIAAIGSAIEVFGKYEKVMDFEGNIIRAAQMLADVRKLVTDYGIKQILKNGFTTEVTNLTRFYVLWRWSFGEAKVLFDDAKKLAQSCGIDLAQLWDKKNFIVKQKEFIRVQGPKERKTEDLLESKELIDVLHRVLLYWKSGKESDVIKLLTETGYGESDAFYRVAQAISETLHNDSQEKKFLDGFMTGRERIKDKVKKSKGIANIKFFR